MPSSRTPRHLLGAASLLALAALPGCGFGHFMQPPSMSQPGQVEAIPTTGAESPLEVATRGLEPASAPVMPGSLWRQGSRSFFRDMRARKIGDLVTVDIEIDDSAQFENRTQLARESEMGATMPNLFGLQGPIGRAISGLAGTGTGTAAAAAALDPALRVTGNSASNGSGAIRRNERIRMQIAATVVRVLPNGNLEIAASQEIRVNDELRDLQLRGFIRPEDIRPNNSIASNKIAEGRIAYGGRGVATDAGRPRWGQQAVDRLSPF